MRGAPATVGADGPPAHRDADGHQGHEGAAARAPPSQCFLCMSCACRCSSLSSYVCVPQTPPRRPDRAPRAADSRGGRSTSRRWRSQSRGARAAVGMAPRARAAWAPARGCTRAASAARAARVGAGAARARRAGGRRGRSHSISTLRAGAPSGPLRELCLAGPPQEPGSKQHRGSGPVPRGGAAALTGGGRGGSVDEETVRARELAEADRAAEEQDLRDAFKPARHLPPLPHPTHNPGSPPGPNQSRVGPGPSVNSLWTPAVDPLWTPAGTPY